LISWSRLISGRFRDPLIGRDILIGSVFGVVVAAIWPLAQTVAEQLGAPGTMPNSQVVSQGTALSALGALGVFSFGLQESTVFPMMLLVLLLVMRILLRSTIAAFVVIVAVPTLVAPFMINATTATDLGFAFLVLIGASVALSVAVQLVVLIRFGLVAAICASVIAGNLADQPITLDLSVWYSGTSVLVLALLLALVLFGFYTSLAGRPLFKDLLEV